MFDIDLTSYDSPFFELLNKNQLSSIKLDLPLLTQVKDTFEFLKNLKCLDLKPRNPVDPVAYDHLVDGLVSLQQLRDFRFKYTLGQGNGDKFIEVLAKALPSMAHLQNLSVDFYLQDGPNRVMVSLFKTLCTLNHLRQLELIVTGYPDFSSKDNTPLEIDLFSHLESLKELNRVSISYDSKLDEKSIESIVKILPKMEKLSSLELSLERMFISNKTIEILEQAFIGSRRFRTLRLRFATLNCTVSSHNMIKSMMKSMKSDDLLIKICILNKSEDGGSSFGDIYSPVELIKQRKTFEL